MASNGPQSGQTIGFSTTDPDASTTASTSYVSTIRQAATSFRNWSNANPLLSWAVSRAAGPSVVAASSYLCPTWTPTIIKGVIGVDAASALYGLSSRPSTGLTNVYDDVRDFAQLGAATGCFGGTTIGTSLRFDPATSYYTSAVATSGLPLVPVLGGAGLAASVLGR